VPDSKQTDLKLPENEQHMVTRKLTDRN